MSLIDGLDKRTYTIKKRLHESTRQASVSLFYFLEQTTNGLKKRGTVSSFNQANKAVLEKTINSGKVVYHDSNCAPNLRLENVASL